MSRSRDFKVRGLTFWRWSRQDPRPRYEHQCWLWNDGRWLHKHFLRLGRHVYAVAWMAKRGKPHHGWYRE